MNTIAIPVIDQTWFNDIFIKTNAEPKVDNVKDISFDPLALILQGRDSKDFAINRKYKNKLMYEQLDADVVPDAEITDQKFNVEAEVIRRHFRNKLMMITLKNHHVSPFRNNLDEILNEPTKLKSSQIPILLRLPDFYQEDKEMESLIDNYVSVTNVNVKTFKSIDEPVSFVKKFTRYARRRNVVKYYFKNQDNQLFCFRLDPSESNSNLMEYFAKSEKTFGLRGEFIHCAETGYAGFNFYFSMGNNYEFY